MALRSQAFHRIDSSKASAAQLSLSEVERATGSWEILVAPRDHHERTAYASSNSGMFAAEHGGAYLALLVTLAAAALAPLVGFDVFDNGNVAQDGFMWGVASIVPAVLTGTLHAVRHHQHAVETAYVERRTEVRPGGTMARGPR